MVMKGVYKTSDPPEWRIVESDNEEGEDGDIDHSSTVTEQIEQLFKKYLAPFTKKMVNLDSRILNQNKTAAKQYARLEKLTMRQKCEDKVIVINVSEFKKRVRIDRLRNDCDKSPSITPQELSNALSSVKLLCLGKIIEGQTRPLLFDRPSIKEA
ncbi:hypothetical protein EVAR_36716_1 [Eumeta japonica]|uniref:Uncharacterized protein n=1 Tax=Eumeta variegata TaxID=151549 RepID=A0A4C1XSE6_EUMVA|nr:hypothetical protein EVAR_36716_1 [Eumeta japonica]